MYETLLIAALILMFVICILLGVWVSILRKREKELLTKQLDIEKLNELLLVSERIVNSAVEGILITDSEGTIIRVNEAFEKMSGYSQEELIGNNPRMMKSGKQSSYFYKEMWKSITDNGYWEGELWDKKKNGELYPKYMSISAMKHAQKDKDYYTAISVDLSNIKKADDNLYTLAYYDSLTGIPNRTLFFERIDKAVVCSAQNSRNMALLLLDLDGFKAVNDTLGHSVGDLTLKEVAARIKSCIRKNDTVARIGGDEFTVLLENVPDINYINEVAQNIIHNVMRPYYIEDNEVKLGVSIGIAMAPDDATNSEELVKKADAAMYNAKKAGKGTYFFYSEKSQEILGKAKKLKDFIEFSLAFDDKTIYHDE
ncbi:sensor domain-containing diguanylate cyclase [Konateibacter massiliensis]|uniref:sensor domain-containing diguanylate cyclase n=1 Tax=Konateibacter massiliensis TaxID=2002841 RepID=UPI000C15FC8A|nr:sensor domain-containing diguanylate cyclase [Konateibacter massiliensis]